jgi:hypothetical protein
MNAPKYCGRCGEKLKATNWRGDIYDLETGKLLVDIGADATYACPNYEEDFRGEGNGHTYVDYRK